MRLNEIAKRIASDIEADLRDRKGLKQEWEQIDPKTKGEIRARWRAIVLTELQRLRIVG